MPLALHQEFLDQALPHLQADPRLVGLGVGGSWLSGTMDEFSDLDLVVAVEPDRFDAVMTERLEIAGRLGPLLAGFTGEHVGEPRLIICLYGPPPLHVDLKFISLPDLARRVEDPVILWERDRRLSQAITATPAVAPTLVVQWLEDRFWIWLHYGATKIGRGELWEAIDLVTFLRAQVLGPMLHAAQGGWPRGVRRLEDIGRDEAAALQHTHPAYSPGSCAAALTEATELYVRLREPHLKAGAVILRRDAEVAARDYLAQVASREFE